MGEDVGRYGGCYAVTKGLLAEFGPERIRGVPITRVPMHGVRAQHHHRSLGNAEGAQGIVRQGRAAQIMQASGKSFIAGKNELLPIPSTEIAITGGRLSQNLGY